MTRTVADRCDGKSVCSFFAPCAERFQALHRRFNIRAEAVQNQTRRFTGKRRADEHPVRL